MSKIIYLDNNSTTYPDPQVIKKVMDFLSQPFGNPSSFHQLGQKAKGVLSNSRKVIANYLQVKSDQIIFTSGGSEGADLCLNGFLENKPYGHIIVSNVEHPCVYELVEDYRKRGGEVSWIPVNREGRVNPLDIKSAIRSNTLLITIMAANNETGVMNDLTSIGQIAEENNIPLVVDGVAWLGKEKIYLSSGISSMFFSGHKIHALPGVGFVYIKDKKKGAPRIKGGPQEFGLRGGTENLVGILSLAEAIRLFAADEEQILTHIKSLRDFFERELLKDSSVCLNGAGKRVVGTTNLTFAGKDGEALLIELDRLGIAASLGSACSSGAIEPSRVLLNMGISPERARRSLRFSFSRLNTFEEVKLAVELLSRCICNNPY